jgi:hypothetical protein
MIKLASNGRASYSVFMGTDAEKIVYTEVVTCITVTCVVGKKLAGIHLFCMAGEYFTNKDLTDFGGIADGASAMYIAGMISKAWDDTGSKNNTGLKYSSGTGGTLIDTLRHMTGYDGVVYVYDTSDCGSELTITASLTGSAAAFTYEPKDGTPKTISITDFQMVAGNIMPTPKKKAKCVIL